MSFPPGMPSAPECCSAGQGAPSVMVLLVSVNVAASGRRANGLLPVMASNLSVGVERMLGGSAEIEDAKFIDQRLNNRLFREEDIIPLMSESGPAAKPMLSEKVFLALRKAVLHGEFRPGNALKPQELAQRHQVSLAVMREALLRAVGEGLAERLPNRGFAVPECTDERWAQIAEARRTIEPQMLRLAVERGDLEWEAGVRAAHHRLSRTPLQAPGGGRYFSDAWSEAHHRFHRA